VFTDPYIVKDINRWTSPQLDDTVTAIRNDVDLKIAISLLKEKFLQSTEALIHGDLHTGSIMVSKL
jgi:5-methylthioribose kinase